MVSVNPAFDILTGHTLEEIFGQDPERFLHVRPHSERFYSQLEGTADGQWQGEIQCRRKNGETFQVWEMVSTVRDRSGKLTHYAIVFSDITAARRAEEQLHYLAHHDPLTGLPNRLLFNERLEHALERARRDRVRCALLFVDFDDFKVINDTLGHASGDALLQIIATRVQGVVRRSDTAARFGGDEFVVIAEEIAHAEDAARLAAKLLNTVSEPIELAGERIAVSASVGICI
jgi:diguanylate cyclase (GGDEF)-like protein/PAS domain S-box-containing protein